MQGEIDRERRRTKSGDGKWWAKALLRPATFKSAVIIGKLAVRFAWIVYKIIAFFHRE